MWRYKVETSAGMARRPISRTEQWLAGLLMGSSFLIVLFTDNGGRRMAGRYAVAVLVAAFIVLDWAASRRRGAGVRPARHATTVGAEGLEPPTPSL